VNFVATSAGIFQFAASIILRDEAFDTVEGRDDFGYSPSEVGERFSNK
jgi:hypothetical protein